MKNYSKSKGRATHETFFGIPKSVMEHPNFIRLTHPAKTLLLDIGYQYNGKNNGDLTATISILQKRGWTSRDTLERALSCLIHYGMVIQTRKGDRNKPALFALSWRNINECKGKIRLPETITPPGNWKNETPVWKPKLRENQKKKIKSVTRLPSLVDPSGGTKNLKQVNFGVN